MAGTAAGQRDESGLTCVPDFEPAPPGYRFLERDTADEDLPEGVVIGQVHYTRLPIFDPSDSDEDKLLFRWANRVHVLTREPVLAQQVLFASGEPYRGGLLEESARLLRDQEYLYDAAIRPVSLCDGRVDVEVITRDTWSFMPTLAFDRSGGENAYSFGFRDSNILGSGKLLSVARKSDTDRNTSELLYDDNNVMGSRLATRLLVEDSDDGYTQAFDLGFPFFSLDTRRSWTVNLLRERRDDKQFLLGQEVSEVEHTVSDYLAAYGFSRGLQDNMVRRWHVGFHYQRDTFRPGDELPSPAVFPKDKTLSYPFVGFELLENAYVTAFNLDQIYRTEDLHLGHRFTLRAGLALEAFGGDRDVLVVDGMYSDTLRYTGDTLLRHEASWEGIWNTGTQRSEDIRLSYLASYFQRRSPRRSFFARVEAVWSHNRNTNEQVMLGGLTGARAYDNGFQTGTQSIVLSLEERLYADIHLFNLIRLGGALFFDVGHAWEPGVNPGLEDEILADVGFGLRFASSKSASSRIVHLDFAFPLTNRSNPDVGTFQVAFNIKSAF